MPPGRWLTWHAYDAYCVLEVTVVRAVVRFPRVEQPTGESGGGQIPDIRWPRTGSGFAFLKSLPPAETRPVRSFDFAQPTAGSRSRPVALEGSPLRPQARAHGRRASWRVVGAQKKVPAGCAGRYSKKVIERHERHRPPRHLLLLTSPGSPECAPGLPATSRRGG